MSSHWTAYRNSLIRYPELGFSLDPSLMGAPESWEPLQDRIEHAFRDRERVEAGEIMNPDEGRAVGHYWLRAPELAPPAEGAWIRRVRDEVEAFAAEVRAGRVAAPDGAPFRHLLVVGIGGSALGPQLAVRALVPPGAPVAPHFLDNTDPGGIDEAFARIGDGLARTLILVVSKSGGTAETRNGMLEAEAAFAKAGLDFPKHAVAVTGEDSLLDRYAREQGWLARFPMADWIGGRTSLMSAVGLLPAAILGIDTGRLLDGAAAMDARTRSEDPEANAAMALALLWHHAGDGRGAKDMVILPYCDRLELMSKYLQQLVMESLGKSHDLDGNEVNQGIAVYGNKGSTDQHAYVQQLRDGLANFFVTFIEVRALRESPSIPVDENGAATGDYLQGFLRGTRRALAENGRPSITLSFDRLDAFSLGALVALYERAVSFYASLVNVNAYHQPGVEAGKKAAGDFLALLGKVKEALASGIRTADTDADDLARILGETDVESVYHCLNHLAATGAAIRHDGPHPGEDRFIPA